MNRFTNKGEGFCSVYFYLSNNPEEDREECVLQNGFLKTIEQELVSLGYAVDSLIFRQREGSVRAILSYTDETHTKAREIGYIRADWEEDDEDLLSSPSITIPRWAT